MEFQQLQQQVKAVYADRPEISEVFFDNVHRVSMGPNGCMLELAVTRVVQGADDKQAQHKQYTACRLVAPPQAMVALHSQIGAMIELMQRNGMLKIVPTELPQKVQ